MTQRPAEETIEYLFRRDRIAVPRHGFRVCAARNDFAVDQHAVAVENDEVDRLFVWTRFLHTNRYPLRLKTLWRCMRSGFVVVQRNAIQFEPVIDQLVAELA